MFCSVTYAGEKNCLTLTVFNQLSETKFEKLWSVQQPPDGGGFCDTAFGNVDAEAVAGSIAVRVPHPLTDGSPGFTVYNYEWNGITYRFAGSMRCKTSKTKARFHQTAGFFLMFLDFLPDLCVSVLKTAAKTHFSALAKNPDTSCFRWSSESLRRYIMCPAS